jgi:hypothetical protein
MSKDRIRKIGKLKYNAGFKFMNSSILYYVTGINHDTVFYKSVNDLNKSEFSTSFDKLVYLVPIK